MLITKHIVVILLIIFFSTASIMKLLGTKHMTEEFENFGYPYWFARAIAVAEALAVFALIYGYWQPASFALGGLILAVLMVGAAYVNFTKRPPKLGWGTLVLIAICLVPTIAHINEFMAAIQTT